MHPFQAHHFSALVLSLLAATSQGLGINCRGSTMCSFGTDQFVAGNLRNSINGIDDNKYFKAGDHIACDPKAGFTIGIPWSTSLGISVSAS